MSIVHLDFNTYLPFLKEWCVMKLSLALPLILTIASGVLVYEQIWKPLIFDTSDEDFKTLNECVIQQIKGKNYSKRDIILQNDQIKSACKKEIDVVNTTCPKVYDSVTCALKVVNITYGDQLGGN
jgi:NAD-specific glutamate dehydrogenase